jgi:hypothetical protein
MASRRRPRLGRGAGRRPVRALRRPRTLAARLRRRRRAAGGGVRAAHAGARTRRTRRTAAGTPVDRSRGAVPTAGCAARPRRRFRVHDRGAAVRDHGRHAARERVAGDPAGDADRDAGAGGGRPVPLRPALGAGPDRARLAGRRVPVLAAGDAPRGVPAGAQRRAALGAGRGAAGARARQHPDRPRPAHRVGECRRPGFGQCQRRRPGSPVDAVAGRADSVQPVERDADDGRAQRHLPRQLGGDAGDDAVPERPAVGAHRRPAAVGAPPALLRLERGRRRRAGGPARQRPALQPAARGGAHDPGRACRAQRRARGAAVGRHDDDPHAPIRRLPRQPAARRGARLVEW